MTGIILAGGAAARMGGQDKALLKLQGETFIERKTRLLSRFCRDIIIVTAEGNRYPDVNARTVRDERPGLGPLMGLYSGLHASTDEVNFVTTVDSPFLSIPLGRCLSMSIGSCDAAVPKWNGFIEPLLAVYRKSCLPHIFQNAGSRKIVSFYPYISVSFVSEKTVRRYDPEGCSFVNINTTEEYHRLISSNPTCDGE